MKYRKERREQYEAKHWHEPVMEDNGDHDAELLAAAQQKDHERPVYREQPGDVQGEQE